MPPIRYHNNSYDRKQQIQAKTKNSVEKCEEVLKPFKPSVFFSLNFIYEPLNVSVEAMGAINIRIKW